MPSLSARAFLSTFTLLLTGSDSSSYRSLRGPIFTLIQSYLYFSRSGHVPL